MNKSQTKSKQRVADHGEVFTHEIWAGEKLHTEHRITDEEQASIENMLCRMKLNGGITNE